MSPVPFLSGASIVGVLGLVFAANATPSHEPFPGDHAATRVVRYVALDGFVLAPDGAPAQDAVVTSSAGGRALVDARGAYRLEIELPIGAEHVQVSARGRDGENLAATVRVRCAVASGAVRVDPLQLLRGGACAPEWVPTFGGIAGTDGFVHALAVFDDGGGEALYAAGEFQRAGMAPANQVARWDGGEWSALGTGTDDDVLALSVFDDGGGEALYAAGRFDTAGGVAANRIAKWDGAGWSALGAGLNNDVSALAVFDDGGGAALYAAGQFTTAGGGAASRVAKWDGASWSALGTGLDHNAFALAVFDGELYVGGFFANAGGAAASKIARWDGASWSAVGGGTNDSVSALATFDDGGGTALYVGGGFTLAGGGAANRVARWNGSTWSTLGSGTNGGVRAFATFDDGSGARLHAAGSFTTAGGVTVNRIARWNGSAWSALGTGVNSTVNALAAYDDGGGAELFIGGAFATASDVAVERIARWSGSSWSPVSSGLNGPTNAGALVGFDDGGGAAVYAGGTFTFAAGAPVNRVAKWDGAGWSALSSGVDNIVRELAVHDDGGGPALYAGGGFTSAGGSPANHIAKWDGASWSALGSGVGNDVRAMAVFDDGGGAALYAAGDFTTAGGGPANRIARWSGSSWSTLGSGISGGMLPVVAALAVFDDGGGAALYAAGTFVTAGGVAVSNIARWNGVAWSALGSGLTGPLPRINGLAVFDDGGGAALYAAGLFTTAGGAPASCIARWDGSSWSALGSGLNDEAYAVVAHDGAAGTTLFATGRFSIASGTAANAIAEWDGAGWSALGGGLEGFGTELLSYDDGNGSALYVGGASVGAFEEHVSKWGCPDWTPPLLDHPSSVLRVDRADDGPGEIVQFSVTASDDQDPSPVVVCVPASGALFPPGTTMVTCTATDASGNQAVEQFPVTIRERFRQR